VNARVIAHTANPSIGDSLIEKLFVAVIQKPALPDVVLASVQRAVCL
jgi:hypothetical protein